MNALFKSVIIATGAGVLLTLCLRPVQAAQTSLKLVPAAVTPPGNFALKMQVQNTSNSIIYVIQTSTNLVQWSTLVAGRAKPGALLQIANVSPANSTKFFRVNELPGNLVDTNPPGWTNGPGGQFTLTPPSGINLNWLAATDNVGVAQYSIYLNGVLLTNLSGADLSYQFNLNYQTPADIRIQATDPSTNQTPILALIYLPANEVAAVSDDSGHVYVFNYYLTNSLVTNGGFAAARLVTYFGANDRGVALGDFDRDGILDLVAAYANGNILNAYFFKGLGDGTFAPGVPLPGGNLTVQNSYVMDMAVGDFDGDGNLDVAINGNYSYTIFYWGNGDGTFKPDVRNWADGNYFYGRGMVSGDFNEDGLDDLARATCCNGMIKVFISNGDRTFIETNLIASGLGDNDPYALAAGDFDEDGHLDLLVAGGSAGNVNFLKGFGNGTFTNLGPNGVRANLDVGTYGGWDAFDYNGDGHLDLVMGAANGQAYFWAGNGDGTFSTNRVTITTGMSSSFGASAPPRPARVDVSITPRDVVTNLNSSVTFSATGTGVTTNDVFRWSFGDTGTNPVAWMFNASSTNQGPTITHNYTNEGRFLARLLHTTTNGVNSVRGTWVIVKGNPPVANAGGPYAFGSQVATQGVWYATLNGSGSTDDFGIVSYIWSFGDGAGATNSVPTVMHGWPSNGVYTVTLTVVDAARQANSQSTTITFTNGAPPVAVIAGPSVVGESNAYHGTWTATFSGTGSSSPVGIWQYYWRNQTTGQTGTSPTFQTTWPAVGTNYVTLLVTANDSQTNLIAFQVVVVNDAAPPVPIIQGPHLLSVNVATNGLWFGAWNATNSTSSAGIYIYSWNFGDGATASGTQVTHQYQATGIYPLTLTVTDNGSQSVTATQQVIVVAGNSPVAKINASTLSPEGAQPISFSADSSTSDHGIYLYTWFFPSRQFTFAGQYLNPNQWVSAYTAQNNKLTVTGQGNWGVSYFFSTGTLLQRGCTFQGQVDTPSTSGTYAMVGLKNLNAASGQYGQYPYAVYFENGSIQIYEYGNYRGQPTNYLQGTAYDVKIVTKPGAGASYYVRPSGTAQAFTLIYDSTYATDSTFSFGADVYVGIWSFENFQVDHVVANGPDVTTPVYPGGTVTLQVVDNALLTNSTSVVVTPLLGTPPVAGISGPTNGQAGVQLAFNGYSSSDDYGIASYTWNFGDGSPPIFGPAVAHSYGTAGIYTNTLTVLDYADQSSTASLVVTIGGSNALVHVPWLFVNNIEQSHPVYAGKTNTLKAVARGVPVPFTYIWNYGDGSGTFTNMVTNSALVYNLEATHAYVGGDGTPYYAGITVILTNGTVYQDTYPLLVQTKTLTLEEEVAIDEGLWHLQKTITYYNVDTNTPGGYWSSIGTISATASSVQAFAVNGHLMTDDPSRDPYVDTVQRGVNYLLNNLLTEQIGPTANGNPDSNGNGIGLQVNSGYPIYEGGPVIDAFVATARPELIAPTGGANVKGRAFKDIVQDMVDMFAWGQYTDPTVGGGWRYGWNQGPDNSASQWGAIGMIGAESFWGTTIPSFVKPRNLVWVNFSMDGYGFGYTNPGGGAGSGPAGEDACTPSALIQASFDGILSTNALWLHGESYLASYWSSLMANNNLYANYSIAKSMRTANPPVQTFAQTGLDWFNDPTIGLARVTINHQAADGSWTSAQRVDEPIASAWSILILSSSLFQQGPVAVITAKPNPSAVGYPVVFDGSGSYHKHPGYKIVSWKWIFNAAAGSDFSHPDAVGPIVTNVYGSFSTNTVLLQVLDNSTPQLSDASSIVIETTIPPYPPTADAGGPYVACAGEDVHLDGSGSFCVDAAAGNFIQSYAWEVNYQVPLTFNQGVFGVMAVITNGYATAGNYTIGLRVKNANSLVYTNFALPDETADAFTTVFVYNRVIPDLKVRPKATKVQLTWTKAGDYDVIMRSPVGPDRGYVQVGQTTSSYATFIDATIAYNTDYYYRIYAYRNGQTAPIGVSDAVFVHSMPRSFDERAPTFQTTPIRLAKVGQLYQQTLTAVSPQNLPMYFSLLEGPTNMTVNAANGQVNFLPVPGQEGNVALSFQVTNSVGRDVLSYTLFIFPASNPPPVVQINGPFTALIGQNIQFSSAGTTNPAGNPLRYSWNFGDGFTSTNPNPMHAYGGVGDYLINLFVNNGYGITVSAQTHAQVSRPDVPPVAVVSNGPSFLVRLGQTQTFDGSGSYSPLGNALTYRWNWGDGSSTNHAANVMSHLYGVGGPYNGSLIVTDNKGESGTNNFVVTMAPSNQPPVVVFAVSTNTPFIAGTVTFDASQTYSPSGDTLTYSWDFGDSTKTTGPLVTHVYNQLGTFTARLTVADNYGGVGTATQQLTVIDAPPVFTTTPALLTRAGTNYSYQPAVTDAAGAAVTFQLIQGPATMSCDPNTGLLNWLPGTNNVGPNAIDLRATDANGGVSDQTYTLIVTTPLGLQIDLLPTHIDTTNSTVDDQSLALSGTVRVYISNNGSDTVPVPFTVSMFVHATNGVFPGAFDTNVDEVVGYGIIPSGFPGNASGYVDMTVFGTNIFKDGPIYAYVDSQSVVPDYNRSNNIMRSGADLATNNPPVIDFSASSLQVGRRSLPTNAVLTARLGNSGLVSVPTNVPLAFYDGDPHGGGLLIGVAYSSMPLDPGMYQDLSVTWSSPSITAHDIFVVADDSGSGSYQYAEITYSNNTFSVTNDLSAVLPPIADAGLNQNVNMGDTVVLNGSGSSDPQGRPLTYQWSMTSVPIGSQAQLAGTNTVNPSFVADVAGLYSAQLMVNNGLASSTNSAVVSIASINTNVYYPPTITSTPSFQGIVSVLYTYPIIATDPQNKPLKFRLPQRPVGMTINTNTGLVQWTPTNSGSFFVQVAADGVGGSYYQGYTLTVIPFTNLPPQFTSTPITTAAPNAGYGYTAVAVSPVNNTITYSLSQAPSGMGINGSSGVISWTPSNGQLGGHPVTITANDGHGGTATQSYNLVVLAAGSNGPVVQPIPDQTVNSPSAFSAFSLDNYVTDPLYLPSQITWSVTGTNLLAVVIDSNRMATVLYPPGVNTAEQLTFLATDPSGKSAYATPTFTVVGSANPPIAAIANLSADSTTSISTGTFNLLGTADDPGVPVPVAYRIGLYDSSGARVADLTPAPTDAGGWHEGRVPAGGSLGTLDFTMVRNGAYTLMLEVQANNEVATATVQISLDARLKLGQVSFSQQDLVLPVKGVGLQIIRTYDSLNTGTADFGYSWTYSVSDLGLSIDEQRQDTQDIVDETDFSLRTGGGRDVSLTMPDSGQRVTFHYTLIGGGLFQYQAVWNPPPGLNASLVPTSSSSLVQLPGLPPYWQAAGIEVSMDNFDFPGFILTTSDGTRYEIDRQDLGEHFLDGSDDGLGTYAHAYGDAYLSRVTQPTGEYTVFVRQGTTLSDIQQYSSGNQKLRSILFQRDGQNRINAIYLPENLDTNGAPIGPASMTYTYDVSGNLASAGKLQTSSSSSNQVSTTHYLYQDVSFPHFITGVVNPQGVTTMRFEYDNLGRLIATYDAAGHKHGLAYNLGSHTSTVSDALGNTTVLTFDDHGNVTAITDPLGNTTQKTFNANNQVTSITDPLGNTRTMTYDSNGGMIAMTDALGNTTKYTMSSTNLVITDPLGRTTTEAFNPAGKVTAITDAIGGVTSVSYDGNGNPNNIVNAMGQQVANATFDSSGRFTGGSNYLGMAETAQYDDAGNDTGTTITWAGASGTNAAVPSTWSRSFDTAGNKLTDSTPDGKTVSYDYDISGHRTGFTDSSGARTAAIYNSNGKVIEIDYPDGSLIRNVYDDNGRVVVTTARALAGRTPNGMRTVYDADGRTIMVQQLSNVVVNVVTQQNLLTSTFVGSGPVISFVQTAYDAAGRAIGKSDSAGRSSSMEYDAAGRMTAIVKVGSTFTNRTEYEYDAVGNKITVRDPLLRETHFVYDNINRLTRTIFPDGSSTRASYSLLGRQQTSAIDQVGKERDFVYDGLGHMTSATLSAVPDPLQGGVVTNPVYRLSYDDFGHILSAVDPLGHTNSFGYDDNERQTSHTLPGGQQESATYDSSDRVVTTTDFNGVTTRLAYDAYGRATDKYLYNLSTQSATQHVQHVYNTQGRLAQLVEPRGTTSYTYDPVFGAPTSIASPEGTVNYDYDPVTGEVIDVQTANTENDYIYDDDGRLTGVTVVKRQGQVLAQPETTTYDFDSLGRRTAVHRPNGATTKYSYDLLDRPALMLNLDPHSNFLSSFAYAYRADGTRSGSVEVMKDSAGVLFTNQFAYAYDAIGRLTNEVATTNGGGGYKVGYTYDLAGNRVQRLVTVAGQTIRTAYAYDVNSRLISESNSVSSAGTGSSGMQIRIHNVNGSPQLLVRAMPSAWSYYTMASLPYVLGMSFLAPLCLLPLRRWRARALKLELNSRQSFWKASITSYLVAAMVILPMDWRATAAEANLFASLNTDTWGLDGSVTTYQYDANGAIIKKTVTGQQAEVATYTYDLAEHMVGSTTTVVQGGHTTVTAMSYVYNDVGLRVSQSQQTTIDGVAGAKQDTIFVLDTLSPGGSEQVIEELPAVGGVPTKSYSYGIELIAQTSSTDPAATQYILSDGHQSTRQVLNVAGVVLACYSYDGYGIMLGGEPTPGSPALTAHLYSGEVYDVQQQQYYLRARYYDPSNGRFTSQDPYAGNYMNPQSTQKYQYCADDPVNRIDPTGMQDLMEVCTALAVDATLMAITTSFLLKDVLKKLSPIIPDSSLLGVAGTVKGFLALPILGLIASGAGDPGDSGQFAQSIAATFGGAYVAGGAAGIASLTKLSMLVVGYEMVFCMASAQTAQFFYFGAQIGTPSNSISVYSAGVWNMWNEKDYTGYFASFGGGAGNYGGGIFADPTDGKPWGISFTFLSESDSAGFGAGANLTYYFEIPGTEENYSSQYAIIPAWTLQCALVSGVVSKNAGVALIGGILGIGTGFLWEAIKELPTVHGADSSSAAYQFYLNQRQTADRPDNWDTGDPEPDLSATK